MPRRNASVRVRAQYSGQLREDERNRRRARLNNRKSHPNRNVNTTTYRKESA